MKRRGRIADSILLALFTLYLGAVLASVGPPAPTHFGAIFEGGGRSLVGPVGLVLGRFALWLLGPILCWSLVIGCLAGLRALRLPPAARRRLGWRSLAATGYLLALAACLSHPAWSRLAAPPDLGGVLGSWIGAGLAQLIGSLGSFLVVSCIVVYPPLQRLPLQRFRVPRLPLGRPLAALGRGLASLRTPLFGATGWLRAQAADWRRRRAAPAKPQIATAPAAAAASVVIAAAPAAALSEAVIRPATGLASEATAEPTEEPWTPELDDEPLVGEFTISRDPSELTKSESIQTPRKRRRGDYTLPPLDLLDDVPKEERGFSKDVLQLKARLLMETLAHYGIEGRINEIRPGPVVTTFEFEPAPGVKVSSITSRQDDLALAMKATRIRIEAPIPGKAAVGIEIPNPYPQMVTLKEVIASLADDERAGPLSIALGKDTEGVPHIADIVEMPHLLVAGATGSGKSVCINAIICNLLLRNGPDRLRFLMVDPKMLELSVYNGIPHLLHPVITEPREALKAVKWAVAEMSARYHKLAKHGVRNIADYNARVREGRVKDAEGNRVREEMAWFVIIIDELADLMMQLGQDLETPVARLAQMARAVGIHLVLATQRPSVNVITGVIKANFPSRIAFRVVTKVDSRTILDSMGAEQLLGKGDMLFLLAGSPQPVRVHGAFLKIEECERIVAHWQKFTEEDAELDLDAAEATTGGVDLGEDELFDEAKRLVVMTQSGSTSMLQRRLRVGYTRAARLMDMLEAAGVVGPFEGSKAREVYLTREELEAQA